MSNHTQWKLDKLNTEHYDDMYKRIERIIETIYDKYSIESIDLEISLGDPETLIETYDGMEPLGDRIYMHNISITKEHQLLHKIILNEYSSSEKYKTIESAMVAALSEILTCQHIKLIKGSRAIKALIANVYVHYAYVSMMKQIDINEIRKFLRIGDIFPDIRTVLETKSGQQADISNWVLRVTGIFGALLAVEQSLGYILPAKNNTAIVLIQTYNNIENIINKMNNGEIVSKQETLGLNMQFEALKALMI